MFGGLTYIVVPLIIYMASIAAVYFSFKPNKEYSLYIILPLFCLPNVRHRLDPYPLGEDIIDVVFACILLSLIVKRKFTIKTRNTKSIVSYSLLLIFSFFVIGGHGFGSPFLAQLKNYLMIPFSYFIAYNCIQNKKNIPVLVSVLSFIFLAMDRFTYAAYGLGVHSEYSDAVRPGGPFEADGLGANHLGAFMAEYTIILICICYFIKKDFIKFKNFNLIYVVWLSILGNIYSLLFSFSRGAWMATVAALAFVGIVRTRKLIILLIFMLVFWQQLLPTAVVQRIEMTTQDDTGGQEEFDSSSVHRLEIWENAIEKFNNNPVFGIGLYNFTFFDGQYTWTSTHNQFLSFLSELGIVGVSMFLFLYLMAFMSGWKLYIIGDEPLLKGLGLGFCGCVIASMICNVFGDRWSQFSLQSLYFIVWAAVNRGIGFAEADKNLIK